MFQVGANVTATNQIARVDRRHAHHRRYERHVHGAGEHRRDRHVEPRIAAALVDDAIASVSALRGELGADQNRFQSTIANLQVTTENLSASESRIRDTDMALEMVNFTRDQILLQAGTAMLAQANAAPQTDPALAPVIGLTSRSVPRPIEPKEHVAEKNSGVWGRQLPHPSRERRGAGSRHCREGGPHQAVVT